MWQQCDFCFRLVAVIWNCWRFDFISFILAERESIWAWQDALSRKLVILTCTRTCLMVCLLKNLWSYELCWGARVTFSTDSHMWPLCILPTATWQDAKTTLVNLREPCDNKSLATLTKLLFLQNLQVFFRVTFELCLFNVLFWHLLLLFNPEHIA